MLHISRAESLRKLDSRCGHSQIGRIREAEMAERSERARISQQQPSLSLSEIINIVSNRHNLRPSAAELRFAKREQYNRQTECGRG